MLPRWVLSAPMRELKLHASKGADAIGTIPGLDKIKDSKGGRMAEIMCFVLRH